MLFIIISVIIVLIICLFLFVPFQLHILYQKDVVINKMDVKIKYLFFTFHLVPNKQKKNKTLSEKEEQKKSTLSFDDVKQILKQFEKNFNLIKEDIIDILHFLMRHAVVIQTIRVHLNIGLDNAMTTAMSVGTANALIYNILALIHQYSNIQNWDVNIIPDFDQKHFDVETECILKIKNVHIMIIAIKGLKLYFKLKK